MKRDTRQCEATESPAGCLTDRRMYRGAWIWCPAGRHEEDDSCNQRKGFHIEDIEPDDRLHKAQGIPHKIIQ